MDASDPVEFLPPGTLTDQARNLVVRSKGLQAGTEGAASAHLVRAELDRLDREIAQVPDPKSALKPRALWLEASIRLATYGAEANAVLAVAERHPESLNAASTIMALDAAGKLGAHAAEAKLIDKLHSVASPDVFYTQTEKYRRRVASPSQAYHLILRRFIHTRSSDDWSDLKSAVDRLDRYDFGSELRKMCMALWHDLALASDHSDDDVHLEWAVFTFSTACEQAGFLDALRLAESASQEWLHSRRFRAGLFSMLQDYVGYLHAGGARPANKLPLEDDRLFQEYIGGQQLAPLQDSLVWRELHANEIAARALKRASSRLHPRTRSIALSAMNTSFLLPLYERLVGDPRFSTIFTDFRPILDLYRSNERSDELSTAFEHVSSNEFKELLLAYPSTRELFSSDVVIYDFIDQGALWASWNLPTRTKLFLRLHAYEAYSAALHLVNWGNVDGIIFVAGHVEQFVLSQLGERLAAVPRVVLPNFLEVKDLGLARLHRRNDDGPRFVLGMAGAFSLRKQPAMALRILQDLRRDEKRWTLRFAGTYWDGTEEGEEAHYRAEFEALLGECGDAVHFDGYQHDIAQWYGRVDYVLSCSRREGTHEAVAEGMLAGVVPIVRDWPINAPFGGPASVYPVLDRLGLIFSDPHGAADIARSACRDYLRYQMAISEFAKEQFDMEVCYARFVEFVQSH